MLPIAVYPRPCLGSYVTPCTSKGHLQNKILLPYKYCQMSQKLPRILLFEDVCISKVEPPHSEIKDSLKRQVLTCPLLWLQLEHPLSCACLSLLCTSFLSIVVYFQFRISQVESQILANWEISDTTRVTRPLNWNTPLLFFHLVG